MEVHIVYPPRNVGGTKDTSKSTLNELRWTYSYILIISSNSHDEYGHFLIIPTTLSFIEYVDQPVHKVAQVNNYRDPDLHMENRGRLCS